MVDLITLERTARRASELGRLAMGARVIPGVVALGLVPSLIAASPVTPALLTLLLAALAVGLRWWHHDGVQAVNHGLVLGAVPLLVAVSLQVCGVECTPGGRFSSPEALCVGAGVVAGVGVALGLAQRSPSVRTWAWGTVVAAVTTTMACVGLGAGALLITVVAVVGTSMLAAVPVWVLGRPRPR